MARQRITDDNSMKLFEFLQNDLKNLSIETKKKFPHIKEACEESIVKLRNVSVTPQTPIYNITNQILYPVVQGCETKDPKIIKLCLGMIQKLITQQAVDHKGARFITDTLWMLMESGTEQVKVLQSVTLLLTTNSIVRGDTLAKNLVLCFRLYFSKDSVVVNTAEATVKHLVSLVFERVVLEDEQFPPSTNGQINLEELKQPSNISPKTLQTCAADAYLMFQDLVQLVNSDQPYWLNGITEMSKTFGLQLLESVLVKFPSIFFNHPEFSFLLKERVCALVIKLFSPNIKFRNYGQSVNAHQSASFDKPCFPVSIRLLRIVLTLVEKYHNILITECEIFLSLIVKFVDPDKPVWQRAAALEVLFKMTVQPDLLLSFCECYDLKTHSTNIFQDIVNCLGAYVQSVFLNPQLALSNLNNQLHGQSSNILGGISMGGGISSQPGFMSRGVFLPIYDTFVTGQAKIIILEYTEKTEPPSVPNGHGLAVAFASFLEIVRSLSFILEKSSYVSSDSSKSPDDIENMIPKKAAEGCDTVEQRKERNLYCQLINSSWCGILSALVPLVDGSTDELITENILKAMQTLASLAGHLELQQPRDAFITAICKASLPPNYPLSILNNCSPPLGCINGNNYQGQDVNSQYSISSYNSNELDYKQQVVAVGTPLSSSSLPQGVQQGPVMLTAKNLQCMRTLLIFSHCHGSILGSSWQLVLTTIQHLVWILGLKPSTGGSLKAGRSTTDTNAVITTAVMADLPVLSSMLSRLFESSKYLNDVALHHLIDALCKLSQEAMELAYCNREPSLFAVAKLLETGLVNLFRVHVLWRPLTNHLLEVCQHPHIRMREWGVEAITYLVKSALQYNYQPCLRDNQKLQTLLLSPLVELSTVPHGDVRQRQLECVLHILHNSGELLTHGWPLILNIVGAISDQHSENLIRIAFQCLQLIVTDFLPLMPWRCLPLCLETTSKFGSQPQELNISLTAIGLMWNIADYLYQNRDKLCQCLQSEIFPECPGNADMPPFDKLWMCLYTRLSALCVDFRPAVRKSAGNTLFSTVSTHGGLLRPATWHSVLWQVLFPLLDKVRSMSSSASNKKVDAGGSILIHHSRNTAQKQWAETQVLTLSGVARVFNTKRQLLQTLGNFSKAWSLLLEFVENAALCGNNEVSLAALRSFQEMLYVRDKVSGDEKDLQYPADFNRNEIWDVAWKVWLHIAMESLNKPSLDSDSDYPSQQFLASLIQIFPSVFQHIHSRFTSFDLEKLCGVLETVAAVPIYPETLSYYMPTYETSLTQLQEGILNCIELLQNNALSSEDNMQKSICPIFKQLLSLCKYAYTSSFPYQKKQAEQKEATTINYVPFGEKAISMVVSLYQQTAKTTPVIKGNILKLILEVFHVPLSRRHDRKSFSTWKLVVASFMNVLSHGIPLARKYPDDFSQMWSELAESLDQLLFPKKVCVIADIEYSKEQLVEDETIDCQIIKFLKKEILSQSNSIPKEFVLKVVILLNKGSILSPSHDALIKRGNEENLREEFAKTCFETLLEFSLLDGLNVKGAIATPETIIPNEELTGHLAVTALLFRFQDVIKQYVEDERRAGNCPLARHRLSEISFVLKAIASLIASLKKASDKVNISVWEQVISLYPHLINCTVTNSIQISESLREALIQYHDLLKPPSNSSHSSLS